MSSKLENYAKLGNGDVFRGLVHGAVIMWGADFANDKDISGADLVEYMNEWLLDAEAAIAASKESAESQESNPDILDGMGNRLDGTAPDLSDIPESSPEFFAKARLELPESAMAREDRRQIAEQFSGPIPADVPMKYAIYFGRRDDFGHGPAPFRTLDQGAGFDDEYARHSAGEWLRIHNAARIADGLEPDVCVIQLEARPGDCERIVAAFDHNGEPL